MDKKYNILIVGGGGREHAIAHTLARSAKAGKLYCVPGNAGIAELAECHNDIKVMDFDKIVEFLRSHQDIDFVIVAPDDPLAAGLVDRLESEGFAAFGPKANAAIIEGSKAFSKHLMKKYNIPTAGYEVFEDYDLAVAYLQSVSYPRVVKADGLALGKGVIICNTQAEALEAVKDMMIGKRFGEAGGRVVIEEFLTGYEVSVLAFSDGKTLVTMPSSQDHKRIFDNDMGPNTGGMGTFSPSDKFGPDMMARSYDEIFLPTIRALEAEGRLFKGVIFFGLMIDGDNIKVLEYNARFGDPETQSVLPKLKTDLIDIMLAVIHGRLDKINIEWDDKFGVCVVMASGGYPADYAKGIPITIDGLDDGVTIFHSGTALDADGQLVTNGGRVLGVTAFGDSMAEARRIAYRNVKKVKFEGAHYRTDIGSK